ncbi:MAG: sugar phosphate isomerase/epimerase [Planctomycetales bacterium]|nr:sugar phosphate isomerase/epimerase [Planctomycetales bacterium]
MFKNLSMTALGITAGESQRIELALTHRFRGLELDLPELLEKIERFDLAHARRFIDSAKMQIGEFQLPFAVDADEATYRAELAKLATTAATLGQMGARRCVTTIAPASDTAPYHQNFELHRARFSEIGDLLAAQGISLGVGFDSVAGDREDRAFEFVHDVEAFAVLLSTTASTNVGAIVDTWQLYACGGSFERLERLGAGRIVAVYLSDAPADVAPAELTAQQRLLPGQTGVIDCAALLVRLAELGYDGPITPAASRAQLDGLNTEGIVRKAAEALDAVWKTAGLAPSGKLLSTANSSSS